MKRSTKILVPIDFSPCSKNALVYAIQLADKIKADLLLLNVLYYVNSDLENTAFVVDELDMQREKSRLQLMKFSKEVTESIRSSIDAPLSILPNIKVGRVESTICDEAERSEVDYIVMGTQGENSTLDKYLGSVASNVLKSAPCPVIVIPEKAELAKKVVIGYATDFSDADPFEIWKAIKLFQPYQPQIKCIHFNEKQTFVEDKIKDLEIYFAETAPELKLEFFSLPAKDKVKDMNDFVEEQNINMLVMYKPKRSFFESVFHKSYTQTMAKHTNIPLLVFKES